MLSIVNNVIYGSFSVTVNSGQRISAKILNADGTIANVYIDDSVPSAHVFTGSVAFSGQLI